MSEKELVKRMYIHAYEFGLGCRNRGAGVIGLRKKEDGNIELSVGRRSQGWQSHQLATAFSVMTPQQAHELATALLFTLGKEHNCLGEGVKVQHSAQLKMTLEVEVDKCTLANQRSAVKKEILAAVTKELNKLDLAEFKETKDEPSL